MALQLAAQLVMAYALSQKSQGAAMTKVFRGSVAVIVGCFLLALLFSGTPTGLELVFTLAILAALVSGVVLLWRRYATPRRNARPEGRANLPE